MSNEDKTLNQLITKAVSFTVGTQRGKKAKGTKIGTRTLDIPIIKIQPFSR